ncbi:MAG: UGMP family protein, partial [Thermoproteus sp.]
MLVLGVESTAHTIGVGIVEDGKILANVNDTYAPPSGFGIHPREAAEHHAKVAVQLLKKALEVSGRRVEELDAVAYSAGPGLGPALRIGAVLARALAVKYEKPLVPVHHGVAHVEVARALTGSCDPL